jgi:hypothetical protein
MDQRKAIFRAKLRETKEKQQRRIDPSLVRFRSGSLSLSLDPCLWFGSGLGFGILPLGSVVGTRDDWVGCRIGTRYKP